MFSRNQEKLHFNTLQPIKIEVVQREFWSKMLTVCCSLFVSLACNTTITAYTWLKAARAESQLWH